MKSNLHFFIFDSVRLLQRVDLQQFASMCRGTAYLSFAGKTFQVVEAIVCVIDDNTLTLPPNPWRLKATEWLFNSEGIIDLHPFTERSNWDVEQYHLDAIRKSLNELAKANGVPQLALLSDKPFGLSVYRELQADDDNANFFLCNCGPMIFDVTEAGQSFFMPDIIETAQGNKIGWDAAAELLSQGGAGEVRTWPKVEANGLMLLSTISVHAEDFFHWSMITFTDIEGRRWRGTTELDLGKCWSNVRLSPLV